MLTITIPATECWDEKQECFVYTKETTIQLEHSLISISKWEERWHIPFLGKQEKTEEQTLDYIRCMCVTPNVPPDIFGCLTMSNFQDIRSYMEDPHTATTVSDRSSRSSRETITAELIYYWMISYNIPVDICQKWHINKLLMLIRVFSKKNQDPKKMSKSEMIARNDALNEARRKALNSKG